MSSSRNQIHEFCDIDEAESVFGSICHAVPQQVRKRMHTFTIVFEDKAGDVIASMKAYKEREGWDLEALGPCAVSSFGGLRP